MVNASMRIGQLLELDPAIANIFFMNGIKSLGRLLARDESLFEAAADHGVDATELTDKINSYLGSKQFA